jgi:ribosomal protein L7/L12
MKREPTEEERERILCAIAGGDRIEAIRIYFSITDCGLTAAQEFIKARTDELKAEDPERFTAKQKRKRWF